MILTSVNGASVKRRVVMNALIIGLGNDYRSDDAVGRVVARKLGAESLDGVRILEESGEGAALMDAWQGADFVILIDAVHLGGKPGTIYRIDAHAEEIPAVFSITRRTHSASPKPSNWRARSASCRSAWLSTASRGRTLNRASVCRPRLKRQLKKRRAA